MSPSARKVWIEITVKLVVIVVSVVSPSARKVWIEIPPPTCLTSWPLSPSARKVWIEIVLPCCDREGIMSPSARKVWIEMCSVRTFTRYASASPSARKVWIEIGLINCGVCGATSHLPRGRCGLKLECVPLLGVIESHLPRGRCGLKYVSLSRSEELYIVTFREEGVD